MLDGKRTWAKLPILVAAGLGVLGVTYLLQRAGLAAVMSAASSIGWGGYLIVCLCALALYPILGFAWYVLLPQSCNAGLPLFIWARMVRDATTEVLPFSHVGGIVFGGRAAVLHGLSQPFAIASTIIDVVTEMFAQMVFIGIGLLIIVRSGSHYVLSPHLRMAVNGGMILIASAALLLPILYRYGQPVIAQFATRLIPSAARNAVHVKAALQAIYRSRQRLGLSVLAHIGGWIGSAAGTWVTCQLIGADISFPSVVAMESLIAAVRSAAILIPGALGIQEAAYTVLTPLFGVPAEYGLAISLLKRARDLTLGVPVVLIWQGVESHRAWRAARS